MRGGAPLRAVSARPAPSRPAWPRCVCGRFRTSRRLSINPSYTKHYIDTSETKPRVHNFLQKIFIIQEMCWYANVYLSKILSSNEWGNMSRCKTYFILMSLGKYTQSWNLHVHCWLCNSFGFCNLCILRHTTNTPLSDRTYKLYGWIVFGEIIRCPTKCLSL